MMRVNNSAKEQPADVQSQPGSPRGFTHGVPASAGSVLAAASGGQVPNPLPLRTPDRLKPGLHTSARRRTGRTLGLLLPILFWAWLPHPLAAQTRSSPAEESTPKVVEWEGKVEISRKGTAPWDPAYTNQVLQAGDHLRTAPRSRAVVRMSSRTTIRVGERSLMRVPPEPAKRNMLNLLKGVLYLFHRDKPGEFPVETPTGYALVLGTEFNVAVAEDGTTRLDLLDGSVTMINQFGQLELKSGEAALAEPGQAPVKTAVIQAVQVVQWCLYYPGVLHLDELDLGTDEKAALQPSLEAYASGDLLTALARYPTDREPATAAERVYLAALLLAVGQVEEAQKLIDSLAPKGKAETQLGRLGAALGKVIAAVKLEAGASDERAEPSARLATEWLAESYRLQSQSRLTEALAAGRKAVEREPDFAFGWERVAELEFSFGRVAEARSALKRSLQLAPRNAQAIALNGFLLSAENRLSEALTQFERAIEIDGALGNAWLGRGLCRIRQGKREAGLEDLQMAATVEPQRAALRSYLGKAFSHAGDNERAEKELDLARKLDANDPTAWLYSALLNQQRNRINEAVRDLERSQELNDNRAVYRSQLLLDQDRAVRGANLANIYRDAGMIEVSAREAARAVNADYANYSAHLFLANTYDALRDPNQVNLRYETPWLSEYLVANLLAPVGAGTLSQTVSQQEYSKLFERNRVGLVSSTEYLSRGDWTQAGAQFGVVGNTGFAVEEFYRSRNGQRLNNDAEQLTLSLQLKQQVTPSDTFYFQSIYYDAEGGDLKQSYDPDSAIDGLRTKESQEPLLLAGYHHEWGPGSRTLLLAGRLEDTFRVTNPRQGTLLVERNPLGRVTRADPFSIEQEYRSELEIYTAEVQQIFQRNRHTVIAGGRFQAGDFQTQNQHANASFRPFPFSTPLEDESADFERASAYAYYQWQVWSPLLLIGGVSYDWLKYPRNFRFAPLTATAGEETTDRVSPKGGLIWTPHKTTTLRAAYAQSLGGVSFDQSFRLEPTQVAGFNQAWRSIIPESVAGANSAARFETLDFSLEQKFPTGTYLGLSWELLRSKVDRTVGVYAYVLDGFLPSMFDLGETREKLDYEERTLFLTVNQLLGNEWSVGGRYRLSEAVLRDNFAEVPDSAGTSGNFRPRQRLESVLHQVSLYGLYSHPTGFFGMLESAWYSQSNQGYAPERPGDDFWQFNAFVGYRFPRRKAELRLGLLNITDQDYRLNPLNLTTELPRDRTLVVSFRFNL